GWYGAPGIYTEKQRKAWERITDAVHKEGGKIFVQLWHTGGVSSPELRDSLPALAPSPLDLGQQVHSIQGVVMSGLNREMSIGDIKSTIAEFAYAAQIAKEAKLILNRSIDEFSSISYHAYLYIRVALLRIVVLTIVMFVKLSYGILD
ncbi:MAG: hypothetical protein WBZ36_31200, partial [Candidatus Nitrosopolaris sp.]